MTDSNKNTFAEMVDIVMRFDGWKKAGSQSDPIGAIRLVYVKDGRTAAVSASARELRLNGLHHISDLALHKIHIALKSESVAA